MTDHEPLFDQLKHERLTHAEKRALRAVLVRRMRADATPSPYGVWGTIRRNRVVFAGTAIGAILFGGTVSYAAEYALPGDVLYEVKVAINERAKVALATTEEARALVQTELAERRLKEAEKLALRGEFSNEKKVIVEEKLQAHLDQVEVVLAQVELKDEERAYDLESDLKSSIDAHRSVIATIRGDGTNELDDVDRVLALRFADERRDDEVATTLATTAPVADVVPDAGVSLMAAKTLEAPAADDTARTATVTTAIIAPMIDQGDMEKVIQKAQDKRTKAVQKIDVARSVIGTNAAGLERLARAEALLAEGDGLLAEGDAQAARGKFEEAARRAQEGKRVSELERELKINVKTTGEQDADRTGETSMGGQGAQVISATEGSGTEEISVDEQETEGDEEGVRDEERKNGRGSTERGR